jgi:hypothetical protein
MSYDLLLFTGSPDSSLLLGVAATEPYLPNVLLENF